MEHSGKNQHLRSERAASGPLACSSIAKAPNRRGSDGRLPACEGLAAGRESGKVRGRSGSLAASLIPRGW